MRPLNARVGISEKGSKKGDMAEERRMKLSSAISICDFKEGNNR